MLYAGVELGGTKCVVILARGANDIVARETIPTTMPQQTLERIETILLGWKRTHGFDALGIASFGPMDLDPCSPTCGHVLATPKPGWRDTNLAPRLRLAVEVPTALDTDVNGAALAEMHWGAGRGFDDFAYVTVGTGVGVGLIVNRQPPRGFAHCELGHVRVARVPGEDWAGSCPYHGDCVEGLASGSALKARFGDQLPRLGPDHAVWDSVAWTLAQLCHAIVCASAPHRIVLGGGVMRQQSHLLARIQSKLVESLGGFMQLPGTRDYVRAPELGDDAGPLGAIAVAMTARP
ncbi:MAG: ROK family protein [Sphingomonas sp.]